MKKTANAFLDAFNFVLTIILYILALVCAVLCVGMFGTVAGMLIVGMPFLPAFKIFVSAVVLAIVSAESFNMAKG